VLLGTGDPEATALLERVAAETPGFGLSGIAERAARLTPSVV
jgi:hypothetical protein